MQSLFESKDVSDPSLLPKISELTIVACKTKVAIIPVLETWLDDSDIDTEI
jgi:hypothetical protein